LAPLRAVIAVATLVAGGCSAADEPESVPTTQPASSASATSVASEPIDEQSLTVLRGGVEGGQVIADPDYRNATYPQGVCGWHGPELRFIDGVLEADADSGDQAKRNLDTVHVIEGDLLGDADPETVLDLGCNQGGNVVWSEILVIDDADRVVRVFRPDVTGSPQGMVWFGEVSIAERRLEVVEHVLLEGDAHCCPRGRRSVTYALGDLEATDPG
jgi:hypothetical protein